MVSQVADSPVVSAGNIRFLVSRLRIIVTSQLPHRRRTSCSQNFSSLQYAFRNFVAALLGHRLKILLGSCARSATRISPHKDTSELRNTSFLGQIAKASHLPL